MFKDPSSDSFPEITNAISADDTSRSFYSLNGNLVDLYNYSESTAIEAISSLINSHSSIPNSLKYIKLSLPEIIICQEGYNEPLDILYEQELVTEQVASFVLRSIGYYANSSNYIGRGKSSIVHRFLCKGENYVIGHIFKTSYSTGRFGGIERATASKILQKYGGAVNAPVFATQNRFVSLYINGESLPDRHVFINANNVLRDIVYNQAQYHHLWKGSGYWVVDNNFDNFLIVDNGKIINIDPIAMWED